MLCLVKIVNKKIIFNFIAGDSLSYHNNQQFTTKNRDNDDAPSYNCAIAYHGAWWYRACYNSNLNGKYFRDGQINGQGVTWFYWKSNNFYSLKGVKMKIRPNPK